MPLGAALPRPAACTRRPGMASPLCACRRQPTTPMHAPRCGGCRGWCSRRGWCSPAASSPAELCSPLPLSSHQMHKPAAVAPLTTRRPSRAAGVCTLTRAPCRPPTPLSWLPRSLGWPESLPLPPRPPRSGASCARTPGAHMWLGWAALLLRHQQTISRMRHRGMVPNSTLRAPVMQAGGGAGGGLDRVGAGAACRCQPEGPSREHALVAVALPGRVRGSGCAAGGAAGAGLAAGQGGVAGGAAGCCGPPLKGRLRAVDPSQVVELAPRTLIAID